MIEDNNIIKLGIIIKKYRRAKGLTLKDIAEQTGISKSLVSKIENLRTIPSLPVITKITKALHISLSELFSEIEDEETKDYIIIRSNERETIEREASKGYNYYSLVMKNKNNFAFQSFFVSLDEFTKRKPVTTNGEQFLFILKGSIELTLKNEKIILNKGDSIYFDGRMPHVSKNTHNGKSEFLSINLVE
jgi:transcriptional regulator with XRE-family HTH domain